MRAIASTRPYSTWCRSRSSSSSSGKTSSERSMRRRLQQQRGRDAQPAPGGDARARAAQRLGVDLGEHHDHRERRDARPVLGAGGLADEQHAVQRVAVQAAQILDQRRERACVAGVQLHRQLPDLDLARAPAHQLADHGARERAAALELGEQARLARPAGTASSRPAGGLRVAQQQALRGVDLGREARPALAPRRDCACCRPSRRPARRAGARRAAAARRRPKCARRASRRAAGGAGVRAGRSPSRRSPPARRRRAPRPSRRG